MRRSVAAWLLLSIVMSAAAASADSGGWGYLIGKLTADGVDRGRVIATFEDPRVGPFSGIDFSLQPPHERRALYRAFLRPHSIAAARRCRLRYAQAFESAARTEGVSANLLAAILFVETGCGRHTGSYRIFTRLARLAMAAAPENLRRNLARYAGDDGWIDPLIAAQLRRRAVDLERTFYPEVRALFTVADRLGVDPLDVRGSSGGAFGFPQFLPTSYLADGVDADGDGLVRLDRPADAAASCARYLVRHGWRRGLSRAERRMVVWQYNHSDAYVDTVLTLAARLRHPTAVAQTRVARHRRASRHALVRRRVRHARRRHAAPIKQARR